ncbi:hypothetical protein TNCV_1171121 [Trichonephila clavipes]|nr:hypothetical protein TNCV_1171121 [Trichonephila clavipes]
MILPQTLQSSSLRRLLLFHFTCEEGVAEEGLHHGVERGKGRCCSRERVERARKHSETNREKKGRRERRDKSEFCNILMLKKK